VTSPNFAPLGVRRPAPCPPSPSPTSPSCPASRSRTQPSPGMRPVRSLTTAPHGLEGEGFPVRRAFAGVDLADLDPFVHLDQMGEVEYAPGRAEGHALAPAPRLRDRDLHDRRHLRAPRLERRRGRHHQRRHAMDDRRRRHPAHREAARMARHERRALPRVPALGEPAARPEVVAAALPGPAGRARSRSRPRPTAARSSGSSPARSPGTKGRAPRTRR
jgi:hypothetical protein